MKVKNKILLPTLKKFKVHKSKPHEICLNYFENFNLIYLQTLYSIFHYGWRKIIRPLCVWLLKSCLILISLGSTWISVLKIIFFQWMISKVLHKYICLHFSLTNLVSLELRENMIQFLPQSMSLLVKLEILDLGSNNIKELVGHHRLFMIQSLIYCDFQCLHYFSRIFLIHVTCIIIFFFGGGVSGIWRILYFQRLF